MSNGNNPQDKVPDHVELPEAAKQGREILRTRRRDGDVEFSCPNCPRFLTAEEIIEDNECDCGEALDLVLLRGEDAQRG